MKRHSPRLTLLAFPLALVACEVPEAETDIETQPAAESASAASVDVAAEEQAIRDREAGWERAANMSVDSFAAFYTADGVLMAPNAPPLQGPAAIVEGMASTFEMLDSLSFDPVAIDISEAGDMAVEQGRYTLSGTMPDGTAFDDEGSYVVVWTKQDGQWMVTHDIFNSDRPLEGAEDGGM